MSTTHELHFLAPIPRGHDVELITFAMAGKAPTLVIDRTAGSVYFPEELWGALHQDPVLAVTDPVAVITRWAWTVRSRAQGTCGGVLISSHGWSSDSFGAKTLLVLDPPAVP